MTQPTDSTEVNDPQTRELRRLRMDSDVYVAAGARTGDDAPPRWSVPIAAAPIAAAAALVAALRFGASQHGLLAAGVLAILVVLAAVDLRWRVVPNRIVFPAFVAVLAFQLAGAPEHAVEWLGAAVAAPLVLLLPAVVDRRAVGMGDVKLAAVLGAALGTEILLALLVASLAVVPCAAWILARGGRAARRTAIPFVPFLAFGAAVALVG